MSRIAVITPVLGRPHRAQSLVDSLRASGADATVYFVCSQGDQAQIDACTLTLNDPLVYMFPPERGDWARKINHVAAYWLEAEEWILFGADDLHFHPGWDTEALRAHEATGKLVIGTNDLGNPAVKRGTLATHALVHRDYIAQGTIDEPGKLLHEGYWHNWVDAEFTETAMARGEFAFAPRSRVEHLHPSWGHGELDDTYRKGLKHFHEDKAYYLSRRPLWRPELARRERVRRGARR